MESDEFKYLDSNFMLRNSPAVTYLCKAYGDFAALYISENVEQQLGYRPEQFINDPSFWVNHIHPDDREKILNDIVHVFEAGFHAHEYRFMAADGRYRWMRDELKLIRDEQGEPKRMVGYWIDITRRKEMEINLKVANETLDAMVRSRTADLEVKLKELADKEKQLLQSQKMEAIGQLTGGIAHDFNNLIGVILGFSEMAKKKYAEMDETGKLEGILNHIINASERASNLVSKLLTFSRNEPGDSIVINPEESIRESINILRHTIPSTIKIKFRNNTDSRMIIDPTQFNQVIMNLIINARDAINSEKGKIDIVIDKVDCHKTFCDSCYSMIDGEYVQITISDNGQGFDESLGIKNRMFDPFFSTKDIGKGSGMGLSVVHGVIHANGGHVLAESEPGKGSSFRILLPETDEVIDELEVEEIEEGRKAGSARIIAVDDESALCEFIHDLFSTEGFEVDTFTSPVEAYNRLKQSADQYDLLMTDQTMPDMSGAELAEKAMQINPDLLVILWTGHSEVIDEHKARQIGIKKFFNKPINSAKLLQAIHELLIEKKEKNE